MLSEPSDICQKYGKIVKKKMSLKRGIDLGGGGLYYITQNKLTNVKRNPHWEKKKPQCTHPISCSLALCIIFEFTHPKIILVTNPPSKGPFRGFLFHILLGTPKNVFVKFMNDGSAPVIFTQTSNLGLPPFFDCFRIWGFCSFALWHVGCFFRLSSHLRMPFYSHRAGNTSCDLW